MTQPKEKTSNIVKIPSTVTVKKFGELLNLPISDIIKELMKNGIMANINEEIDFETANIIAADLGIETQEDLAVSDGETITLEHLLEICRKEKLAKENLASRPPIVTVLGHVDHGKTTLLDTIRKASVAEKEAGGITQHISAYQTKKRGQLITFVDTPGHAAFSAMRERGVSIADIAILVVAANDGVRPQTKEVIEYLKDKKIPTIVAINKIDVPEADPQRVKQELAELDILVEEWGGKFISNEISAKKNIGIDALLESILLVSEVEEFVADPKRDGLGVVLESHLDPQRGPISIVLVRTGTFKVGQDIAAGNSYGRIKRIEDFSGKSIEIAPPSTPVVITGLNEAANVNDILQVVSKKSLSQIKSKASDEIFRGGKAGVSKQQLYSSIEEEKIKKLNVIIKSDVQGSLEAIEQILSAIKSSEVAINYIDTNVGNITESDVKIAESSNAIIYGFNVTATSVAKRMAESKGIEIKSFNIIYELIDDIKNSLASLLPPEIVRTDLGRLKVLAIFKTGKKDMIVGGKVIEGKVSRKCLIDVKREKELIGSGTLTNLQHNKKNVDEVSSGSECGLTFEGSTKIEEGDVLEFFTEEEVRRKL
ncbi:MAG: translation initiation factor IF-2 [Candidatus Moranbacteria bacterium]|nr:translation initiation factor IF-2 [Candidatus Moranbacteria bacterium]